jgi:hypothetical protein
MCDCKNVIYLNRHTKVCENCGVETRVPFNMSELIIIDSYNTHSPFSRGYCRLNRFKRMLYSIIYPCPQLFDNKTLKYLGLHSPIRNKSYLLKLLKKSPVKDKRYCSLHLYCKLFCLDYVPPRKPENIAQICEAIMNHFKDIEFAHHKYGEPFFNYQYLLNLCLKKWNLHEYLKFTKTLKCRNRRRLYNRMYAFCMKSILANRERQALAYA